MKEAILDPARQQQVLMEFALKQAARAQRAAYLRRARFGAPWLWVGLAIFAWLPVAASGLLDLTSVAGRIALLAPVGGMTVLAWLMARSIGRAREQLFLSIIEQEAPAEYRRLQEQGIVRAARI